MKLFYASLVSLISFALLTGCGGSSSSGPSDGDNAASFKLACDLNATYTPSSAPLVTAGVGSPTTTVIALHGKSATPTQTSHMQTLADGLNAAGYDVMRPYLPWTSTSWNGTLCDGIAYVNSLVAAEQANGKSVVVLGHSLGGVFLFSYAALDDTAKPDAFVSVAPGHFVPNSYVLATDNAADVQRAEEMIANGQGDVIATFTTSGYNISATAYSYLSFHGTDQSASQFPDIFTNIERVDTPMLWLAGTADPITDIAKINLGIIPALTGKALYTYTEIVGDHYSLMSNVTAKFDPWYQSI